MEVPNTQEGVKEMRIEENAEFEKEHKIGDVHLPQLGSAFHPIPPSGGKILMSPCLCYFSLLTSFGQSLVLSAPLAFPNVLIEIIPKCEAKFRISVIFRVVRGVM